MRITPTNGNDSGDLKVKKFSFDDATKTASEAQIKTIYENINKLLSDNSKYLTPDKSGLNAEGKAIIKAYVDFLLPDGGALTADNIEEQRKNVPGIGAFWVIEKRGVDKAGVEKYLGERAKVAWPQTKTDNISAPTQTPNVTGSFETVTTNYDTIENQSKDKKSEEAMMGGGTEVAIPEEGQEVREEFTAIKPTSIPNGPNISTEPEPSSGRL